METKKSKQMDNTLKTDSDLSEQIKAVTKDSHVRAENTQLMLNYQKGQITLPQYKLLLCSLYEIYRALEEQLDRNSSHLGVAPIYFPQELARLESLERDLQHFFGPEWRKRVIVPAATQRYTHRLRQIGKESPNLLVAHAYTRYLGDLSGGQVLGRITQKSMGLSDGEGASFFSFPGVSSPNRFKQLYRSRMNSIELTEGERERVLEEAVRAFELNIEVFDDLQKMLSVAEATDLHSDLSEQIKAVTKDSHVRAENTQLMLNYQKGQITLPQYKLLLCSLYEIYRALEEELDRNSSHLGVAPIYFPQELARLESLERDLQHFFGPEWRKRVIVPAATQRYTHRLRQIGKESPNLLVAHAYTRYLGDLSGGQVLGRITQKSMGLSDGEGASFFSFPGVSSPNRFKQLYRSRMNSMELTEGERERVLEEAVRAFELNIEVRGVEEGERERVLEEAVRAFELNIQVFDDLQKMLNITEAASGDPSKDRTLNVPPTIIPYSPAMQFTLGVCIALATVGMGIYAF